GYIGGRRTFDWTVRVPRPFLISGSGTVVREFEDKEEGQNVVQVRSEAPVTLPLLIFGRFQKAENLYTNEETKKTVKLTIHSFPNMTIPVTDPELIEELELEPGEPLQLSAPLKKINGFFAEAKEILKLYEKIYGPYPYDELHIGQMAPQLGFGQGPPGFVRLTGAAFMSQAETESDFIHGFLSHEFAHQWWGNQVGWASEDDEWLSEAFAEYASGIFVKEYQGAKRFQRTLEEWKRFAKNSDKEGPIAAANTLSGPTASDYRGGLLYQKGAYILHMLRTQLNDDKYVEVMRSIQENYRHQNISTEMLLGEVNRVTKTDYTSFFDQWIWDVGIPVFEYRWRTEKQADGKFLITVHVGQRDKTNVKKVLMPVHIHFKDKSIPQYKPIVQAEQELKILSPMEPKNVTLDDDHTLLADIVKLD
ncbi:MAG: M1 family metallopeptidase, partial [Candidatus Polarisedimenticolia bacterium]